MLKTKESVKMYIKVCQQLINTNHVFRKKRNPRREQHKCVFFFVKKCFSPGILIVKCQNPKINVSCPTQNTETVRSDVCPGLGTSGECPGVQRAGAVSPWAVTATRSYAAVETDVPETLLMTEK